MLGSASTFDPASSETLCPNPRPPRVAVGHRALVAVESGTGSYDLYHSQWGGAALADPNASRESVVRDAVESGTELGTDRPVKGVLAALDPREYEALLVRRRDGVVEPYLVVWGGFVVAENGSAVDESATDPMALVPVTDAAAARRVRRAVRETKDALGDLIDGGAVRPTFALGILRARVRTHPDVPETTLWIDPT